MDMIGTAATDTIDFASLFGALPDRAAPDGQSPALNLVSGGQAIRLVAFSGTGGWHRHDHASETVIVWSGSFDVEYRDRTVTLGAGQCTVIAPGHEHRGVSASGAHVVLLRTADAG